MRNVFTILTGILFLAAFTAEPANAQIRIGGRNLDTKKLIQAGSDAAKAITLSDADIANLSHQAVAEMDRQNPVAPENSPYAVRLKKLTGNIKEIDGMPLNFKVYEVKEVNAFACGDGSIRIFAGLMDLMDDGELIAVIGHEIGHVAHTDTKDAMKNAYLASAARNAMGMAGGKLGELSQSQLGDILTAFTSAQFSQKQEFAADDYGYDFAVQQGYSPFSMANSLDKLVKMAQGSQSSLIQRMFASHPDSEKRAARVRAKAGQHK